VFTVPRRKRRALEAVSRLAAGVPLTRIGTVTTGRSLAVIRQGVKAPLPAGFMHFR
jgi:thiamine monophosphate kinase